MAGNNTVQVTPYCASGDGTIAFTVPAGTASDLAGNPAAASSVSTAFTEDNTAPSVSISAPSVPSVVTGTGSVSYTVNYGDANFNTSTLSAANITLNTTGTANGTVGVSGSGASFTVTISGITGTGTLEITVANGTAYDLALNVAGSAAPSQTFNVLGNDATLSNLTLNAGLLTPGFRLPALPVIPRNLVNGVQAVTIVPTTNDPNATILINGTESLASGTTSNPLPVSVGSNTITIQVTAQDGVTTQTYTLTLGTGGI